MCSENAVQFSESILVIIASVIHLTLKLFLFSNNLSKNMYHICPDHAYYGQTDYLSIGKGKNIECRTT